MIRTLSSLYFSAALAAIGVAVAYILPWVVEIPPSLWLPASILPELGVIYVSIAFWKFLRSHVPRRNFTVFFSVIVATETFFILSTLVSLPGPNFAAVALAAEGIAIAWMAGRIIASKANSFGLLRAFAFVLLVAGVLQTFVYLIVFAVVPGCLALLLLAAIFFRAGQEPAADA